MGGEVTTANLIPDYLNHLLLSNQPSSWLLVIMVTFKGVLSPLSR
ncbi:hypothetical protein FDUTEX481_01532 [Tolypothrix sp. PCC 7601]|nr:hypothetical protein FDUTEX481_01532 [Tolypothrix sp. PCC 7601]